MNKLVRPLLWLSAALLSAPSGAQETTPLTELPAYATAMGIDTVPTFSEVAALQASAQIALDAKDCDGAIPILTRHAQLANQLSNLMDQSLSPYHRAIGDAQLRIRSTMGTELAPAQDQVYALRSARNDSWLAIAECHISAHRPVEAAAQLHQALGYLDGTDFATYRRARDMMWRLVGSDLIPTSD